MFQEGCCRMSNSFALLRRRMARWTALWVVALPRLGTLSSVREGACGCLAVWNIYRYARFEIIKQPAQKNQKWYTRPFQYQYHSQTISQTLANEVDTMFNPRSKSRKLWVGPEFLGCCKYGEYGPGTPLVEHFPLDMNLSLIHI